MFPCCSPLHLCRLGGKRDLLLDYQSIISFSMCPLSPPPSLPHPSSPVNMLYTRRCRPTHPPLNPHRPQRNTKTNRTNETGEGRGVQLFCLVRVLCPPFYFFYSKSLQHLTASNTVVLHRCVWTAMEKGEGPTVPRPSLSQQNHKGATPVSTPVHTGVSTAVSNSRFCFKKSSTIICTLNWVEKKVPPPPHAFFSAFVVVVF